jgi:hypothetical protein
MTRADGARVRSRERNDHALLDDARDLARQAESGIDLRLEWAAGDLYPLLLDAARGASAVVVGEGTQPITAASGSRSGFDGTRRAR